MSQETTRRVVGLVLGILLVLAFAAFAGGLSDPEIPDGAVAIVEDVEGGEVTNKEFETALEQVAASQGLRGGVPKQKDPQYAQFAEAAISELILERWIRGEAADLGLEVSDREVDQRLEQIKQQNFGSDEEFEKFLKESGFTLEDAQERIRLTLLTEDLQKQIADSAGEVPAEDVETVYQQQIDSFTTPESRDVLTILNKSEDKVEQAKKELEKDDSKENWARVADEFSADPSAAEGGLLSGVIEGEGDPAADEEIFAAEKGELVGPFEVQGGFQLIQVTKITPEEVAGLDDVPPGAQTKDTVAEVIEQQVGSTQQQAALDAFQSNLEAKWRERTFCSDELLPKDPQALAQSTLYTRCANFEPPVADSCTIDDPTEREQSAPEQLTVGCPAPVVSRQPASPQELTEDEIDERTQLALPPLVQPYTYPLGAAPQGQPQRALPPPPEQPAAGALPPGSVPIGAPGAVPPGAVPPTGAPPAGAAPPAAPPPAP